MAITTTWGFMNIPKPESTLEETSWQTISMLSRLGLAKKYFNIGDTKRVYIDGRSYEVRIIGFDSDIISETDRTFYGREFAGITFQLKNILKNKVKVGSSMSWATSNVKKHIDGLIPKMDGDLQQIICSVDKPCRTITSDRSSYGDIEIISHKLFNLSISEVFNEEYAAGFYGEGAQYQYFKDGGQVQKWETENNNTEWLLRTMKVHYDKLDKVYTFPRLAKVHDTTFSTEGGPHGAAAATDYCGVSFAFCV